MAEPKGSEQNGQKDVQKLWNIYLGIHRAKGFNLDQLYAELAAEEARKLTSPGAREDFANLCNDGCKAQVLALMVTLFRHSPRLEAFWTSIVGPAKNRQQTTRTLTKAVGALKELFGRLTGTEDEELNRKFAQIGRIPPARLVSELRFYIKFVNAAELIAADTGNSSLRELLKYILSGYVKRATGRFHDNNVSGLIAEISGPVEYNEFAHRMWRTRNYKRLEKHFSGLVELLFGVSVAMGPAA